MRVYFFNPGNCSTEINWSQVMLAILEQNYGLIPDEKLATIIGIPERNIRGKARLLKIRAPKIKKEKIVCRPPIDRMPIKIEKSRPVKINYKRPAPRNERKYATRQIDYTKMKSVRVDQKTVIFIPVDQDPEQAILLFNKVNKDYQQKKALFK